MNGTMMDVPLTLELLLSRADQHPNVEVVTRRPDRSLHRTTYGEVARRAKSLARALIHAGVRPGDRVATLMWNTAEHLEAYFGIPLAGAVIHTLNLRLHPDEIAEIAKDGGARVLLVDDVLLPLFERFRAKVGFEKVITVGGSSGSPHDYEAFLTTGATHTPLPTLREDQPLGMCFTSGTTGRAKGVVYTHRSTVLHSIVEALPDALDLKRANTLLPVVPMFHVNAWGLPYTAMMVGAKLVFPGPHLDPVSLLELMEAERVDIAAGVPTIWMGIRDALDANPGKWKLRSGIRMIVGGAAAPEALIRDFDRLGLYLLHAWGMTETSPVGTVSRLTPEMEQLGEDECYRLRAKQGRPTPLVDLRIVNEAGPVPPDGKTSGEIQIRGPWIAARYVNLPGEPRWTEDGWFKTGDVGTLDQHGAVQITDRVADMIKSGGEWISSIELENAIMGHPAVKEAAVISVPHPKWSERPIAAVVFKPGLKVSSDDLKAFLAPKFAKFQLPDAFVELDAIPRTSAGKFKKTELRDRFRDWKW